MIHYWVLARPALLLKVLLPAFAGIALFSLGWYWNREAVAFVENMRATEGRIVEFRSGETGWRIDVEHLDVEGVPYRGTYDIDAKDEPTLRASGRVNMIYDTRNPQKAELGTVVSASNEAVLSWATLGAGVLCVGFGLFSLLRIWYGLRRVERLFLGGTAVRTEVRELTVNRATGRGVFTYAFRGPNGRWFEGKSPEMTAAELGKWPVGTPVSAVYDPANPKVTHPDVFGVMARRG